jgi:hypothetical protein
MQLNPIINQRHFTASHLAAGGQQTLIQSGTVQKIAIRSVIVACNHVLALHFGGAALLKALGLYIIAAGAMGTVQKTAIVFRISLGLLLLGAAAVIVAGNPSCLATLLCGAEQLSKFGLIAITVGALGMQEIDRRAEVEQREQREQQEQVDDVNPRRLSCDAYTLPSSAAYLNQFLPRRS